MSDSRFPSVDQTHPNSTVNPLGGIPVASPRRFIGLWILVVICLLVQVTVGCIWLRQTNHRDSGSNNAAQRPVRDVPETNVRSPDAIVTPAVQTPPRNAQSITTASRAATTQPAWASDVGTDGYGRWADLTVSGVTQRFRWIEPGTFTMGSPQSEKDTSVAAGGKPEWYASEVQHAVTLTQGYWLADSECTQHLWQAVMGSNPSRFTGDANRPVEQVTWDDCQQFFSRLNSQVSGLRACLPTEAQWEYACRAGTTTPFSFGATITPDQVNCNGNYPYGSASKGVNREQTVPVKTLPANAWGLFDMHGNVLEWCADWYADYASGSLCDPLGPGSGSYRVIRGGGWYNGAGRCRSADRGRGVPGSRGDDLGFRLLAQSTSPGQ